MSARRIGRARAVLFPSSHAMGPWPRGLQPLPMYLAWPWPTVPQLVREASGLWACTWIAPNGVYAREADHVYDDPNCKGWISGGQVVSWQFSQWFFGYTAYNMRNPA